MASLVRLSWVLVFGSVGACGTGPMADPQQTENPSQLLAAFEGATDGFGNLTIEMVAPDSGMLTNSVIGQSESASFEPSIVLANVGTNQARGVCTNDWMWLISATASGASYSCTFEVIFDSMSPTAGTCNGGATNLYSSAPFFPFHPPSDTLGYDNVLKMNGPFNDGVPVNRWWIFAGAQTAAFSFSGYILAQDGC